MAPHPDRFKEVKQVARKDILFSLAATADPNHIAVGSSDGKVHVLAPLAKSPAVHAWEGHRSYVTGLCHADSQLISASYDRQLIWRDAKSGEMTRAIPNAHQKWIRELRLSPDGKTIASVADDMECHLWDAATGRKIRTLRGHAPVTPHHFPSMLYTVAFSHNGKWLATADKVGKVVVWEIATGTQLAELSAPVMYTWDPKQRIHSIGGIRSVAFSPDDEQVAVGGIGKIGNIDHLGGPARVEIFDWKQGKRTHEFPGDKFKGLVECLHFSPDGSWLFAGGGDHGGFVTFFDLEKKKIIRQDKIPMHLHDAMPRDDFKEIVAVGHHKVAIWSLA